MRYSDHTVRVYTSYFRDFQQHFEGRKIETVTPGEINDYLLYLIHEKNISSCQQNQRINAIKFYYEKVLGQERRCYKVNRAKREKTLPDVLSKEEIKKILDATVTDLRFFCMFSILYSAGLRISELLELKPGDINESRSLIRVRQGKGKKDRYTLLSKPLMKKLTEYNRLYKPKVWLFEHRPGEPFTEYRVETAEGSGPGSGNHETDLSAPAAPFVRHPLAGARNRHQDCERAYGT